MIPHKFSTVRCVSRIVSAFLLAAAVNAGAQSFGIHFLGGTTDPVTSTAGVVPIANWNNINNETATVDAVSNIVSSDGLTTAQVVLSGGAVNNGWESGLGGDGGDLSLMDGYIDDGYNGDEHAVCTISNLTKPFYTVYIYFFADNTRPGNNGDLLPNYSINGRVYYVPILGNSGASTYTTDGSSVGGIGFNGYILATASATNSTSTQPSAYFGNYLVFGGVAPSNGVITVVGEADTKTFRSPLNGIELIASEAPVAAPPTYTPTVTPVYAGTALTLNEDATGPSPLSYQWLADNGTGTLAPVSGATESNFVYSTTGKSPGNYEFAVVVTNISGSSTSAVLTLPVIAASAPILTTDITPAPANEGYVGETVTFSASFTGTLPINYQWTVNKGSGATPILSSSNPSATNSTLTLSNLALSDAGTYTLTAANTAGGPVSSSSSTLTVIPDPAPPTSNSYAAAVLALGPTAYWRFNENADPSTGVLPVYDATGNNFDATYGQACQNGFDGITGPQAPAFPGFESNNFALAVTAGNTNSWVTVPPLDLNTNAATQSIILWLNPTANETTYSGIFMNRPYSSGIGFGGNVNASGMAEIGYTWNENASDTWSFNSGLFPIIGVWSFVGLVVEPTQATLYLYYIDPNTHQPVLGSIVNAIPHEGAPFNSGVTTIGIDPSDLVNRGISADIDEVAIFNKALTGDQILSLFGIGAGLTEVAPTAAPPTVSPAGAAVATLAGTNVTLTALASGSSPISYQWQTDSGTGGALVNIAGATSTTLAVDTAGWAPGIYKYDYVASNSLGTNVSPVATINIVSSFMLDIGPNAPTPGPNDISQLLNSAQNDDGFNYYTDNGANHDEWNGQTFMTGGNAGGYTVTSFAWKSAGNGSGFGAVQAYDFMLFSLSSDGSTATLISSNSIYGGGTEDDWFKFINLNIPLAANSLYAYAFGRDASASGWEHIGNQGNNPYAGGQICQIPAEGGAVSYGPTGASDATFDLGLQTASSGTSVNISAGAGGALGLSWSQGTLLQSTNVNGPWTTNTATSPLTVEPTNSRMFFKILVQ